MQRYKEIVRGIANVITPYVFRHYEDVERLLEEDVNLLGRIDPYLTGFDKEDIHVYLLEAERAYEVSQPDVSYDVLRELVGRKNAE